MAVEHRTLLATPVVEVSKVASEWARSRPPTEAPLSELERIAKRIQDKHPGISYEQAYSEALEAPAGRTAYAGYLERR